MRTPGLDPAQEMVADMPPWLRPWTRFWFTPIDPTGFGFLRICCGFVVFFTYLMYSYDLFSYVGPHCWLDQPTWTRTETPVYEPPTNWADAPTLLSEKDSYVWSFFLHVQDPFWIVVFHVGVLVVMLLFMVGLWTRVTSVLTWMGVMCYIHRLPTSQFGMDAMIAILLLYMMIGNGGAALSLDRWLEVRRLRREQGPSADLALKPSWSANLAVRLFQIHFCTIYLVSGLSKLQGAGWWNGTAIWWCLANPNFAPMRIGLYHQFLVFLCQQRWLWEIYLSGSVAFTLFTEIGFAFLVWNKKWRPIMVGCSVLLHIGIGLIMGLVVFSLCMLTMVLAFVPPDQSRLFVESLVGWVWRGSGSQTAPPTPPAARKVLARVEA